MANKRGRTTSVSLSLFPSLSLSFSLLLSTLDICTVIHSPIWASPRHSVLLWYRLEYNLSIWLWAFFPWDNHHIDQIANNLVSHAMFITRGISLVNFAVASSALAFQVFVLYPWHHQLDHEFKALKQEHLRVLQRVNQQAAVLKQQGAN